MSRSTGGRPAVLLTLGRLPVALDFARAFALAGWRVVIAEPFRLHLAGASRVVDRVLTTPAPSAGKSAYLDRLRRIARDEAVDLILPISEEAMHVAHLAGALPPATRLLAPPAEKLLELHDKLRFNRLAHQLGLAAPPTALLGSAEALAIAEAGDFVVKPLFSSSGQGVSLHAAGARVPAPRAPALVQRRLEGAHLSSFSIASQGRVQGTVVYRATITGGTIAVAFERVENPAVDTWVEAFVERTGHSGMIAFDFIVGPDGRPQAIECNPRATSGVHFFETADLAPAMFGPFSQSLRLKSAIRLQNFFPALTATQASILRPAEYRRNLGNLLTSRDVTWCRSDPLPLLAQPLTALSLICRAIAAGQSLGAAATTDIGWFEGERAPD